MNINLTRFAAIAAVSFIAFHAGAACAATVGHATDVIGTVTVKRAEVSAPVKSGDGIEPGDIIQAQEKSRVKIIFDDKTEFVIGGPGKVTVDAYIYNPGNSGDNKAEFSVLGAAFAYVGGLIERDKKPNVKFNLDFGSIG
ncbi:MAG: hypothetical protein EPN97_15775, partial [Alphaproteobacteria bacterium]